jgi:selenocysteine lyase/cysteine desulfurase
MRIQDARQEFPALAHQVFLDSACVSLAPQRTVKKLREFLDMAAYCHPRIEHRG